MIAPNLSTSVRDCKLAMGSAAKVGVEMISLSGIEAMYLGIGYKEYGLWVMPKSC